MKVAKDLRTGDCYIGYPDAAKAEAFCPFATLWKHHDIRWIFFTVLLCAHFTLTYISRPNFLDPSAYLLGQAKTPYQYRVLPRLVIQPLVHSRIMSVLRSHAPHGFDNPYTLSLALSVFVGMLAVVFATRATITSLTDDSVYSRWASLIVVYMTYFNLAPGWGLNYTLPYDVPSLLFFSVGIYCIINRSWKCYYLMYMLAVFNRETICFLTVFLVVYEWRGDIDDGLNRKRMSHFYIAVHAVLQVVIWCTAKLWLRHLFSSNTAERTPGIWLLVSNLHELVKPQQWPVLLSVCGFLLPFLWTQRKWIMHPQFSQGAGVVMCLWFLGMLCVGVIPEIRIFSEWAAFATPMIALIVFNRLDAMVKADSTSLTTVVKLPKRING